MMGALVYSPEVASSRPTFGSTLSGRSMRLWDLSPRMVLARPHLHERHWKKIGTADVSFPLELFRKGDRWVMVDGYHRLAHHHLVGSVEVPVRLHSEDCWNLVRPAKPGLLTYGSE
jgi:hypothetical protein